MSQQQVFVGFLLLAVFVAAFETKNVGINSRIKRFKNNPEYDGGETDIAALFPVRTITVSLPSGVGVNGNPPSDSEILNAVSSMSSAGISSDQLQVVWSTRDNAQISAKYGTNLYGSFTVFFNI